jgi:hypothetical protein
MHGIPLIERIGMGSQSDGQRAAAAAEVIYQYALNAVQQMGVPADCFPLVAASVSNRMKDFALADQMQALMGLDSEGGDGVDSGEGK